jgi:hypothetical protein
LASSKEAAVWTLISQFYPQSIAYNKNITDMNRMNIVFLWFAIICISFFYQPATACPYKDALSFLGLHPPADHAAHLNGLRGHDNRRILEEDTQVDEDGERKGRRPPPPPSRPGPQPAPKPAPKPGPKPGPKPPSGPPPNAQTPTQSPVAIPSFGSTASAPFCAMTNGAAALPDKLKMCGAYSSIVADFNAALPTNQIALSNLYGKALRLAFHDAGKPVFALLLDM